MPNKVAPFVLNSPRSEGKGGGKGGGQIEFLRKNRDFCKIKFRKKNKVFYQHKGNLFTWKTTKHKEKIFKNIFPLSVARIFLKVPDFRL